MQRGQQGHDPAIDLATHRRIADNRMNGIGKINGRGAPWQSNQAALRGKTENLIMEQFKLGMFQKFFRIAFGQLLDRPPQPRISAAFMSHAIGGIVFIESMGRDAVIGDFIHLFGTDLQFNALAAGTDHRGMNGTVIILFGR